ncbi:peptidoglycan DD-metalloendopeptidase family protein [Streptomyces sp. NPDC058221]|uniref:M23 family metallopeptidase n=1 Tax=Streptomyces sp. NPDC058221 TaxID=3346388 RepID=UPI0036E51D1B
MPTPGKHRRPKSSTIARGVVVASAGGAVIALPLLGATGANAAEQAAPATAKSAAATHASPAKPVADKQSGTKTYSVVSGDYLSKIAAQHKLKGGWEKLYQDNRKVVGDDPSLIFPGMKLTLGGKATGDAPTTGSHTSAGATTPSKAPSKAPAKTESKASTASNSSSDTQSSDESSADQSAASGYVHPVPGNHTTAYRASGASWSSGSHTGIDFPVSTGTSVKAVTSGTVVTAGWGGAYGNEVVIKHADGHYSQYGHMSSLSVSAGQAVTAGQQVGLSGATGNATGPHLHFEVRTGPAYGSDIDPIAYLASHGINV